MAKSKKRKYPKDVYFRVVAEEEDIDVRGNAMASGDDEVDKKYEDEIISDLQSGNEWAWAYVKVIAEYEDEDGNQYEGHDGIGGCSYKNEHDFVRNSGYYEDMKSMAFDELTSNMKRAGVTPPWVKKSKVPGGGKRRHAGTKKPSVGKLTRELDSMMRR